MKKLLQVSLQVKILGLVVGLLLLVLTLVTFMVTYMESGEDVQNAEDLALQTATTLSYMPVVQDAFKEKVKDENVKHIADRIRDQIDASAIKIIDREGQLVGYSGQEKPESIDQQDYYSTLTFGGSFVLQPEEDEDVLKAVVPIRVDYDTYMKVEGAVAVEFKMKDIYAEIRADLKDFIFASSSVLILGVIGSILLARSIRKDTLGLEPFQIAALFRERNAVLDSVKEGLIAFDQSEKITMINASARELLDLKDNAEARTLNDVITSPKLREMIESNKGVKNKELQYKEKTLIINSNPILEGGVRTGIVVSVRDKTEIKQMVDALSEVKQYSEDLRAQAHEFTSKLYVIMGLIQLEKYQDAIELIKEEADSQKQVTERFFKEIVDEKVQAILLGKFAKASEKKIDFYIEDGSSLQRLPAHIPLSPLIIILGNIINNAFEGVAGQKEKTVSFFVTDLGHDIIFEVTDNGTGIRQSDMEKVFAKGYSSKGTGRGYGLANVKEEVDHLHGSIEINSIVKEGTTITIILPKEITDTKGVS
ncbi:ATP-binding protein [Thalassobacillus devorans]|uniref:ATP-binding protein n=1 Tax=Thalassobacillus devorans TaxID=279813 RepID=UPI00048B15D9|nr:sensor histidine kinase [Thalassobacillus devorans]